MIDAGLFIGTIIIALTQLAKALLGRDWKTVATISIAMAVGGFASQLAPVIGLTPLSVAQGLLIALGAVGIHTLAKSVGVPVAQSRR